MFKVLLKISCRKIRRHLPEMKPPGSDFTKSTKLTSGFTSAAIHEFLTRKKVNI